MERVGGGTDIVEVAMVVDLVFSDEEEEDEWSETTDSTD